MERSGVAGKNMMMQAGIFGMISNMLHKGFGPSILPDPVSNTSYRSRTGSFKQNQRKERKVTARRNHRRLAG